MINSNQVWLSNEMAEIYADKYELLKTAGSDNHWGRDIFSRLREKGFRPEIPGMSSDIELESVQDYIASVRSGSMKFFLMNEESEITEV